MCFGLWIELDEIHSSNLCCHAFGRLAGGHNRVSETYIRRKLQQDVCIFPSYIGVRTARVAESDQFLLLSFYKGNYRKSIAKLCDVMICIPSDFVDNS